MSKEPPKNVEEEQKGTEQAMGAHPVNPAKHDGGEGSGSSTEKKKSFEVEDEAKSS
jgi:hypothetical protein